MALSGSRLGGAVYDALVSGEYSVEDAQARAIWETVIGPKIVDEIINNAVVASGIAVTVDPDTGAGSTTGTGTIS